MKPKSDLRTRLGRAKKVPSPEDEDTVSTLGAHHPARSAPAPRKSGPYLRGVVEAESNEESAAEPASSGALESALAEGESERRHARQRARRHAFALGITTACLGGLLGLAFGTQSEKHKVAEIALSGAGMLIEDLEASNAAAATMSDVLGSATRSLAAGKFPSTEASRLRELDIPFSGVNLANRAIGRFKRELLSPLFEYVALAAQVNLAKQRLGGLLSVTERSMAVELEQRRMPTFKWAVFLQNEALGPVANLQRLPEPFLVTPPDGDPAEWPGAFELRDERGKVTLKRYAGGDPLVAGESVQLIPVAPETEALVCPNDAPARLMRELNALGQLLNGDQTPGHETPSLLERGRALQASLGQIGRLKNALAQNAPSK
jgi:hypothetical protein